MALGRYDNVTKIAGGRQYGTTRAHASIRQAVEGGAISAKEHVLQENERLDILAGKHYGNARLWWIIAAASGIGWGLQVPPGTSIMIPTDLTQVRRYL